MFVTDCVQTSTCVTNSAEMARRDAVELVRPGKAATIARAIPNQRAGQEYRGAGQPKRLRTAISRISGGSVTGTVAAVRVPGSSNKWCTLDEGRRLGQRSRAWA